MPAKQTAPAPQPFAIESIHRRVWTGDQSKCYQHFVTMKRNAGSGGAHRLRVNIRRENDDRQGRAVVEVWCNGIGWTVVGELPPPTMQTLTKCTYVTTGDSLAWFTDDEAELFALAFAVLA